MINIYSCLLTAAPTRNIIIISFVAIGISLILTIWALTIIFRKLADRIKSKRQEQKLKELTYTDTLTGLSNGVCFDRDVEKIIAKNKQRHTYIAVFDVNELRQTNDLLGHFVGDTLIKTATQLITTSFRPIGKAYRLGGDEFAVIATSCRKRKLARCIDKFNIQISQFNKYSRLYNVSIAYAVDKFKSKIDNDIYDLYTRVDRGMYLQKQAMKDLSNADYRIA